MFPNDLEIFKKQKTNIISIFLNNYDRKVLGIHYYRLFDSSIFDESLCIILTHANFQSILI